MQLTLSGQWMQFFAGCKRLFMMFSIMGFLYQADAESFPGQFRERLRKFGLEQHPDKTRLAEFGRFAEQNRERGGEWKPETFDFPGFTHSSGKHGKG
jgi:hypothetical protein